MYAQYVLQRGKPVLSGISYQLTITQFTLPVWRRKASIILKLLPAEVVEGTSCYASPFPFGSYLHEILLRKGAYFINLRC